MALFILFLQLLFLSLKHVRERTAAVAVPTFSKQKIAESQKSKFYLKKKSIPVKLLRTFPINTSIYYYFVKLSCIAVGHRIAILQGI